MNNSQTTRALFSLNSSILERFKAIVPDRERSKAVERLIEQEIENRQAARAVRLAILAQKVETHADYREVRAVAFDVDAISGETL